MGITKSTIFTKEQNDLAQIAKVLGHPARIAILQHIVRTDACICGDLVKEIGLAQATISQHLRELKNIEIIKGNISGTSVCYCINQEKWEEVKKNITNFLNINQNLNCC